MQELIRLGIEHIEKRDFKGAAQNWCVTAVSSYLDEDDLDSLNGLLRSEIERNPADEWPLILLSEIYLDNKEFFSTPAKSALEQVYEWSIKAIQINPNNRFSQRAVGTSLYWMDRAAESIRYYQKAHSLGPQPDLAVRIYKIQKEASPELPFDQLRVDLTYPLAVPYYTAGADLRDLVRDAVDDDEQQYMSELQEQCYFRSIELFREQIFEQKGSVLNAEEHMFAMCCNNLGLILTESGRHAEAFAVLKEGQQFSDFLFISVNILKASFALRNITEYRAAAVHLFQKYDLDDRLYFSCAHETIADRLEHQDYAAALGISDQAIARYGELDDEEKRVPSIQQFYPMILNNRQVAENGLRNS